MPQVDETRRGINGSPASPPVDERVSFQVHRVNAKLAQVANALFRRHDLDLISSRILVILLERREIRVGQLVDLMVLPQSTISHQLQRLDARGLLSRTRIKEDNRSVAVTLTEEGRRVAAECNGLSLDIYRHMTGGLSDPELDQLRLLLGRMFATLDTYGAPRPES